MSVQVKVSFPHKDWRGDHHDVGEVYACSQEEADTRVRDGFVRLVDQVAQPAVPAEYKAAKTAQSRKAAEDKAPSA
ncbi:MULTISPECIES: hypothetical protein [unclassified Streptomyces]|uniref:hypothetical protein n=1 Tax=unclassified Streptomyces TaxID=2593676 RepID=UPI003701B4BF